MIRANCRGRLTVDDFEFIVGVLSGSERERASLERLLVSEEERDAVLDCEALGVAILDSAESLSISPGLMFYVLCRKVLKETPASSRECADFVASLLEGFLRDGATPGRGFYISDMMEGLRGAGSREEFLVRSRIANSALFACGFFAECFDERTRRRGAPDITFYEGVGSANYRAASGTREAQLFDLSAIYEQLAEGFHEVRLALNDLADRLLHMDRHPPGTLLA